MILLALTKTERISDPSSINTQRQDIIFFRCLPATTYFPEAKLSSTFLPSIFWKYSKTFHQQPENVQRLFRLQICLSCKSSAPENIQRLFRLQKSLSRKSPKSLKYSKTFQQQQPAAIRSSNQEQQPTSSNNHQQQPAAATSSSNQQQQLAAATSSSNQQQQPAAATRSSKQLSSYQQHLHKQRRPPLVITTVPSEGYIALAAHLGLVAR